MQTQTIFPQDLFDLLADEAIGDLCKTGLSYEETHQILENFWDLNFRKVLRKSCVLRVNKNNIDPDFRRGR